MISGSGRLGSCVLISFKAFWTASPNCCLFAASFEAAIASRADTTNTIELMVGDRMRRVPFAVTAQLSTARSCC
jgi:hypothetical protein